MERCRGQKRLNFLSPKCHVSATRLRNSNQAKQNKNKKTTISSNIPSISFSIPTMSRRRSTRLSSQKDLPEGAGIPADTSSSVADNTNIPAVKPKRQQKQDKMTVTTDLVNEVATSVQGADVVKHQLTTAITDSLLKNGSIPATKEKPKRGRKTAVTRSTVPSLKTSTPSNPSLALQDDPSICEDGLPQNLKRGRASTVSNHAPSGAGKKSKLTGTSTVDDQVIDGGDAHLQRTRDPSLRPKTTLHPGLPDMPKPKRTSAELAAEAQKKKNLQNKLEELRKSLAAMEADEEEEQAEEEANRVRFLGDVEDDADA